MILLDTNVISEVVKEAPSPTVVEWINGHNPAQIFVSAVTIAELQYGIQIMPIGRRQDELRGAIEQYLELFPQPFLSFDEPAARSYGEIKATRRAMGRPMSDLDGQIAAIARVNGLSIATRNVKDFDGCGLELINPFDPNA